ncbi:MAG: hypothetical protein GC154_12515 [bacterium]|nr:hypothetical protein [bacterium]
MRVGNQTIDFFAPVQDWGVYAPLLIGLALILLAVTMFSGLIYWLRYQKRHQEEIRMFFELAERYNLTQREANFLRRLSRTLHMKPRYRILTEQDRFERAVRRLKSWRSHDKQHFLESIRQKLFGMTLHGMGEIRSTHDLIPGSRLLIQHSTEPQNFAWGHLVDKDDEGLLVVAGKNEHVSLPLRPDTPVTFTVYVPRHDPVRFASRILKPIPGPSRMIVLEHAPVLQNRFMAPENNPLLQQRHSPLSPPRERLAH